MEKLRCFMCSAEIDEPINTQNKYFHVFIKQLFQLLMIPSENIKGLQSLCTPGKLCPQCLGIADEIIELKMQATTLELIIQHKVEAMGKAVVDATSVLEANALEEITNAWSQEMKEWWMKFQYPVIQNFAKGYLPNPQVRMKQCDEPSTKRCRAKQNSESFQDESTQGPLIDEGGKEITNCEEPSLPAVPSPLSAITRTSGQARSETDVAPGETNEMDTSEATVEVKDSNESEFIRCPLEQCQYKREYGYLSKRNRACALSTLCYHYAHRHCEARRLEPAVNIEGQEYFPCKFCTFRAFVQVTNSIFVYTGPDALKRFRRNALYVLARHEVKTHFSTVAPITKRKVSADTTNHPVKVTTPNWTRRVFRCPLSNCNFSYEFKWCGKDDEIFNAPYGLEKLGDHCLRNHLTHPHSSGPHTSDSEHASDVDHYLPHVDSLDGIHHLKCPYPQCSCIFLLEEDDRLESYRIFSEHYGAHIYGNIKNALIGSGDRADVPFTVMNENVQTNEEIDPSSTFQPT